MKRGVRHCVSVSVSVCVCVTNRALISPVFAGRSSPNSGRGWIHIWHPRFQELDQVQCGVDRDGSREQKKNWVFFWQNFELEYLARFLRIIAKPGVLLGIREGNKHT